MIVLCGLSKFTIAYTEMIDKWWLVNKAVKMLESKFGKIIMKYTAVSFAVNVRNKTSTTLFEKRSKVRKGPRVCDNAKNVRFSKKWRKYKQTKSMHLIAFLQAVVELKKNFLRFFVITCLDATTGTWLNTIF